MVLEVFSELENKIKQSIDTIVSLKSEVRQFKSQTNDLKKEIDKLFILNNKLQDKNKDLQEEHLFWKNKLLVLSKKINDFMLEDKY